MKILLTLFVLLFSSSVVAENLPKSLFGIELYKINPFSPEEATLSNSNRNIGGVNYRSYNFKKDKVPKLNSNFDSYLFFTDQNKSIVHILGYTIGKNPDYRDYSLHYDEYECSQDKESLIESLKLFYSIDQFKNIELQSKKNDDSFGLTDRDYIEISSPGSTTYNRVLAIECTYYFDEYWFKIRLDSRDYYSNLLKGYDIVSYLDFDLLINDLSGL